MAIFNVLDFGATADDLTDDSAAIQAAIDAAYDAGGGTVYIGAGTFIVSGDKTNASQGCVEVRSNVTLRGEGMGLTTLKLADGFDERINGIVRTPVGESVSNVAICNLTIDGNRENNIGHQAGIITGVKANDSGRIHEDITISGVEVMNCTAYGVNPHELTYDLTVENCVSHDNGKDGFVADYVVGAVYRNNTAYDNDRHGFNVQNSSNGILLENNQAYGNGSGPTGGAGLVVQRSNIFPEGEDTIPWVTDVQVVGGEYYNNTREGILIKLSDGVDVTGADVHDNLRQGIRVEGATNTLIHDNEIYNNSQENFGSYDEINIRMRVDDVVDPPRIYYSEGTKVYDNNIHSDGTSRYGIREEHTNSTASNPSGTVVYDNIVSGMLSGDIYIPPHGATEGDDFFYGTTSGDSFAGLGGNDTYVINHSGDSVSENVNAGYDAVVASLNYTLAAHVENLQLTGTAIRGTGNDLANNIIGNHLANELEGLDGDDVLDGMAGADVMQGGDGNDTYVVDNVLDEIVEKDHEGLGGFDTVFSTVDYTLAEEVENLFLQGDDDLNATGNSLANELIGNAGHNRLDGMAGADTMRGGEGDDVYIVDHTGDIVSELAGEGFDTVRSSLTYTLGSELENLELTGSADRDGTGNALGNIIVGNAGSNKLRGMDGDDALEGGLGADQLYGGAGNDLFILRKGEFAGDVVEDFSGNGSAVGDSILFTGFTLDAVLTRIGTDTWQVQDGSHLETLRIKSPAGADPVDVSDYSFDGAATPPPANSAPIASQAGNSTAGQEDTLITGSIPAAFDADGDTLSYSLVAPLVGLALDRSGAFSFTPPANASGTFSFQYVVADGQGGQSAAQEFAITVAFVNDAPIAATTGNNASGMEDTVISGSIPAGSDVEQDALTYSQVGALAGLSLNTDGTFSFTPPSNQSGTFSFDYVIADASNAESVAKTFTITIDPVNDAPIASAVGNAAFGSAGTMITGQIPSGFDADGDPLLYAQAGNLAGLVVQSNGTFGYTPPSGVTGDVNFQYRVMDPDGAESEPQTFTLTVSPSPDGLIVTGNNSANTLFGGTGDDIIDGAKGADTMYGYAGNDTYYVDSSSDKAFEAAGAGFDRVFTTSSFTIGADSEIEFVQALGTLAATLKGNGLANTLIGNSAANTLSGNDGDDILDGGVGRDMLAGGKGEDVFVFSTALGSNNVDQIKDFKVIDDTIHLDQVMFSALSTGQLSQDSFIKGAQALDASDHIIYDDILGQLLYDTDGAGGADAIQFASIGKGLQIDYSDFVVYDHPIA